MFFVRTLLESDVFPVTAVETNTVPHGQKWFKVDIEDIFLTTSATGWVIVRGYYISVITMFKPTAQKNEGVTHVFIVLSALC